MMDIREAIPTEIDLLARLWYDGWQDAHASILPAALAKVRTLSSFAERLQANLADVRVAGQQGAPIGLCIVKGDELNQLYVSAEARGTGVAAQLLADGEQRINANGAQRAWLACAIGNERAARFYQKNGWQCVGEQTIHLETPEGEFPLEIWRYEKRVG